MFLIWTEKHVVLAIDGVHADLEVKLIQRHIFAQVFVASLFAVGIFVFVLVAGNVIRDVMELLIGGKLPLGYFLRLLGMLILYVSSYALPMGFLMGILLVLGRLSEQHEIVALKASGVSLLSIAKPIFLLAFMGVLLCLFVNFYYAPMAKRTYKEDLAAILKENPLQYLKEKTFIDDFPGYVIYVDTRDGTVLRDLWIWELDRDRRVTMLLKARKGIFEYDAEAEAVALGLEEGSLERRRESDPEALQDASIPIAFFKEGSITLPLMGGGASGGAAPVKLSAMTYGELKRACEGKDCEHRVSIQTQIQKNYAMAFSVLALVAIGIPLGIKMRRKETYANLAIAVVLALIYYTLMIVATWLEGRPDLRPDLLVWVPNLLFMALGGLLFFNLSSR